MASRARDSHFLLGIRQAFVCFLGIISTIEAQNSIPSVVISAAPEAQTTLPPGDVKGTYIASDGSLSVMFCEFGEVIIVSSTYAACCPLRAECGFGIGCDGPDVWYEAGVIESCHRGLECFGSTIFDKFPSPTMSWVDWGCPEILQPISTIYLSVDTNAIPSITSSGALGSKSITPSTKTFTSVVVITIEGETRTKVTQVITTETVLLPDDVSITGPVSSSSGSEDNASTTSGDSAPTSSTTFYGNPVPEIPARPASSRAWIVGVVAGPLLALVAVGGLLYWLKRHRQRKTLAESGGLGPGIHAHDPPCIQADFEQSAELSGKTSDPPPMCELEATEVHQGPFQGTGGAMRL